MRIDFYRVVDSRTIEVGAGTGPTLWTRVVSVQETPTQVEVGVNAAAKPGVGTAGQTTLATVHLSIDLGDRIVFDALTGYEVADCTHASTPSSPPICVEALANARLIPIR